MGGATSRIGPDDTAFGDRSAAFMLSVDGNWTDPSMANSVIAWTRRFIEQARQLPGAGGTYLNFVGDHHQNAQVVREQYGDNFERLVELKQKYDPNNLFRINNNIQPDQGAMTQSSRTGAPEHHAPR